MRLDLPLDLQDPVQQVPSWDKQSQWRALKSSHFAAWSETHPKAGSPSEHSTKLIYLLRLLLREGEGTYISL